jgi:hypothetical protein
MKRKYINIGISLLIALCFILPAGAVLAGKSNDADDINTNRPMANLNRANDITSQQPCLVEPMGIFDPDFGYLWPYSDIPEGVYDLWAEIYVEPGCGPAEIKVFLEVYKKCCGKEVVMYETSFEDNYDIYNNWVQIDEDCGFNSPSGQAQYDSWSHSEARASDGEFSMKCSMYDIYKGNQDDFLECTKSFDISDQYGVNVSFDIWVDGQQDWSSNWAMGWLDPDGVVRGKRISTVYDYLDFEVSDWIQREFDIWYNPDNWFNGLAMEEPPARDTLWNGDYMIFAGSSEDSLYPGAYKFANTRGDVYTPSPFQDYCPKVIPLTGGWWHVYWEISTAELIYRGFDVTDMVFRFSWHSDPENQYEGAYVDNFKVVSIEDCEDKVFQTHTQGPVIVGDQYDDPFECFYYVDFPLDWEAINFMECGRKETCYDFKLWIEVLDPFHYTNHDWPFAVDIPICVGDFYDCQVLFSEIETSFGGVPIIPGPGVMEEGEDMHLTSWVHLQGTIPASNVPVLATAHKKEWVTLYENDFESGSAGWEFGSFGDPSLWHRTNLDAWCGSGYSLGCFDENTGHYRNDMYVDYALCTATFDLADYLEMELSYFYKMITEGGNDYWLIMLYDPATNFVLGNGPGVPYYGYYPTWMGPEQPQCRYVPFDMMAAYDYWHDIRGMFRNSDCTDSTEVGFGFAMWETDSTGYINTQAEANGEYWSGLFIDNVKLEGLIAEELVWSDVIIIPEMEPCQIYEVQFEWEDIPYSNYLITVDCNPEGGCDNWDFEAWTAQILVVSNKEKLHPKEVEPIDFTDIGEGEWVCSTSDTEWYLATNSAELYTANANQIAQLCPDSNGVNCSMDPGDACCLDLSFAIANGLDVLMDAKLWWDIEGGLEIFDYVYLEYATVCPADQSTDWIPLLAFGDWFGTDGLLETSYYYTGLGEEASDGWITLEQLESIFGAISALWIDTDGDGIDDIPIPVKNDKIDLLGLLQPGQWHLGLRWRFVSDPGWQFRGMKIDWIEITNLLVEGFPPEAVDFFDDFEEPCHNTNDPDCVKNWCMYNYGIGSYWFHKGAFFPGEFGTFCNFHDEDMDGVKDPAESTVANLNDALYWFTEIEDCYEAYLAFETDYQLEDGDIGWVEIDDGSGKWWILYKFEGTSGGWIHTINGNPICRDISHLAGKAIQLRFRLTTDDDAPVDCDHWCIRNVTITGKQDHTAPTSTATMTGTMKDSGWYASSVNVKITANDNIEVKEIHYILDGQETVVSGDTAEFTVSGNGVHNIEFWAVDILGNTETPHNVIPTFRIDAGSAPTVSITAPEPGLYLFGNKILSASKVLIIGAFTIEATASDQESGIYKVQFFLDGDIIAEDTELPFSAYCAVKHMGDGTIRVVAEDFAQNTAEDTLDITYYKFL